MNSQRVVLLLSVGDVPTSVLQSLVEPLKQALGVTAQLHKTSLAFPKYAFNKDRNQYHTNAVMKRLAPLIEPHSNQAILGVLDVDLFIPDSNFVFGEADRDAKVAVLSTFRMKGSDEQTRRRLYVEAIHQSGHLLGLSYCEDARCVMAMSQTPADCDRKNVSLCALCRNEWARMNR